MCNTALALIDNLAVWICSNPNTIDPLFQIILHTISKKELAYNSVNALHHLFSVGRGLMSGYLPLVDKIFAADSPIEMRLSDKEEVLKGASRVIGALNRGSEIAQAAANLCRPFHTALSTGVDIIKALRYLTLFFRNANPGMQSADSLVEGRHPLFEVAVHTYQFIEVITTQSADNDKIMEECNQCVRFIIRCLGLQGSAMLEKIAQHTGIIYLYIYI